MKRNLVYVVATILFLTTFTSAQFGKLKLPKINKKKVEKHKADKIGKSIGSSKGKNRQMTIDDGFTFFEATPVKVHSPKLRGYVAKGWTLTANLRAFGTYPDNSGFKMVVRKSGNAVATYSCEGKVHRKSESPVSRVKNSPDDDYMSTTTGGWCGRSESIVVKKPGKYDVQIYVVNGDNDVETLLRTYKVDVREAKQIRPGGVLGVSDFYIQRHAEAPAAILYLRPGLGSGYVKHDYHEIKKGTTLKGNVDIYFNIAKNENSNSIDFSGIPYVRCFVNGQRVKFVNKGHVKNASMRGDRAAYKRNGKPTEYIGFYSYWINLPIEWRGNGSNGNPNMERQTGKWKCDLRSGAETIRTFSWTVGSDGFPNEHPEQTRGNINLHWGAYLIDMKIPEGGSSIDQRLMAMPNAGFFYGIPWATPEGKKMAARVPAKGKPFLTP